MPSNIKNIPNHIAIIMDGNGRWATQKFLSRQEGHLAGLKTVEYIVKMCCDMKIKHLTLYAFSKENWKRPIHETSYLMKLLIKFCIDTVQKILDNNIKISILGEWKKLPRSVYYTIVQVLKKTQKNNGLNLNLAINYSGQSEIVQAIQKIHSDIQKKTFSSSMIDEFSFKNYLYLPQSPDPDILIRTGGENRISNFLLWQISKTEIYVTKTFWPDFNKDAFHNILQQHSLSQSQKQKVI